MEQELAKLRMLWASFMTAQMLFVGILFFLFPNPVPFTGELSPETLILMMIPGSFLIAIPLVRRSLVGASALPLMGSQFPADAVDGSNEESWREPMSKYLQITIVGMAFAEAAGIFGFTVGFINEQPVLAIPLVGWGLLLSAWQFPSQSGLARVVAQQPAAT